MWIIFIRSKFTLTLPQLRLVFFPLVQVVVQLLVQPLVQHKKMVHICGSSLYVANLPISIFQPSKRGILRSFTFLRAKDLDVTNGMVPLAGDYGITMDAPS
jgi:hypothetical protein